MKSLSPAALQRASDLLKGIHFNKEDVHSMHAHADGSICYACRFPHQEILPVVPAGEPSISKVDSVNPPAPIVFPEELKFNSRPGSANVLWLNFEGQDVTGTEWNTYINRALIAAKVFSTDTNYENYSAAEKTIIKHVWQRVAEDYAPFDINVTTERPAIINNQTAVCLITSHVDKNGKPNPAPDAGGVAYVDVFGIANYITKYSPAFVYHDNLGNRADYITDASSHEVGHNMGLSHDGKTDGTEYYRGHGSGNTSWAPIMGAGYDRSVTQWSKGEYTNANNTEDDLAIIQAKVSYATDDHGDNAATATPVVITGGINIVSTNPETDPDNANPDNKGVIETNDDVDVFSFTTGAGAIQIAADPWVMSTNTRGGNLDIILELYDDAGNLLQSTNPESTTGAIIGMTLQQGNYFLHIKNTGAADPTVNPPLGYTAYGSIGQYFLSGTIVEVDPKPPVLNELFINNDAVYTTSANVTLNHTKSDGIPDEYRASENPDLSAEAWLPYSSIPAFTLGGYGTRTVYMQLRNSLGDSEVISDSINYPDPTDPPVLDSFSINNGDAVTPIASVTLNHTWSVGIPTQYRASENSDFAGASWRAYAETPTFTLSGYGTRTVYFQLRNSNDSTAVLSDSIIFQRPATIAVSFEGVAIASGYQNPRADNGTDFGKVLYRDPAVSRTFTVANTGEVTLSITSVVLPVGFLLADGLPATLEAGESDTFTVRMSNTLIGTNTGQVVITNSDTAQTTFRFAIKGIVGTQEETVKSYTPVAYPTRIRTFEDKNVSFLITGSDPRGRKLVFRILEKPKYGKLSGTAPNMVYVPDLNKNGVDFFTFEVYNGTYRSAPARVDLVVTPVNDPPVAINKRVLVPRNGIKAFRLKATDVDTPLTLLRYEVIGKPKPGILRWDSYGKATFIPAKGFVGSIRFDFVASDRKSISKPGRVTLVVE